MEQRAMKKPVVIIDIETTGLDAQKHEIIEIGAVRSDTGETFEVKIHPLRIKDADPEALAINGYRKEDWNEAFTLPNALLLLNQFVGDDKPHFMAYNVSFDWGFIQKAYSDCGMDHPFDYRKLDLLTLAWAHKPPFGKLNLGYVCNSLGIRAEPVVHRAINGAMCAHELMKKLTVRK